MTTIAIRETVDGTARKLTKLIPLSDGGFSVLVPYHKARSGVVFKMPVDYKQLGKFEVPYSCLERFTASNRVKLSYHFDGFAQFSGEGQGKIISGRDLETGEPRGVGLMSSPLDEPVSSGPSFAICASGLVEFDELNEDSKGKSIVFGPDDFYHRSPPNACNGWLVEGFVFPERYWAAVRFRNSAPFLNMSFMGFEASQGVIEFHVVPMAGYLIGLFASRIQTGFPVASAWTINGPGYHDAQGLGEVIMASYPQSPDDPVPSLDYVPKQAAV